MKRKDLPIILICLSITTICLTFCLCLALFGKPKSQNEQNEPITETTDIEETRQTYPAHSPQSLKFENIGVGECKISGIGNFVGSDLKIPEKSPYGEKVVCISKDAFKDCTSLVSISIPASIKSIEDGAFAGCTELVMISVDTQNKQYSSADGILYSKGRTTLIFCPPSRIGKSYLIDSNVKIIADNAFANAKNLRQILYEGSPSEFESIYIGNGNQIFLSLPITCNYVGGK